MPQDESGTIAACNAASEAGDRGRTGDPVLDKVHPGLPAEIEVDRIPELLGEIERRWGRAVGASDETQRGSPAPPRLR